MINVGRDPKITLFVVRVNDTSLERDTLSHHCRAAFPRVTPNPFLLANYLAYLGSKTHDENRKCSRPLAIPNVDHGAACVRMGVSYLKPPGDGSQHRIDVR